MDEFVVSRMEEYFVRRKFCLQKVLWIYNYGRRKYFVR